MGLEIYTPELPDTIHDTVVQYFVYPHMTETTIQYFGFSTVYKLDLFRLLLSVKGVGVKTAFAMMCKFDDPYFVSEEDLRTVKGIGKSTAAGIRAKLDKVFG